MNIRENVDLKAYSTMRLGGPARYLAEADSQEKLMKLIEWAESKTIAYLIIGGGSNIIWRDEGFDGLVIVNKIMGREVLSEDAGGQIVQIGAGENWDDVVAWTVDLGLSGLEFLSLIPGTAGAGPVQNIGAYGKELSDTLKGIEVFDKSSRTFGTLPAGDCGFAYRTSRFKTTDKGRFVITSLSIKLDKTDPQPPFYESLQQYFDMHDISQFTPLTVRQAVMAIRPTKLPDPSSVANNGSFFTNPFVTAEHFQQLKASYPDIKGWPADNGRVKASAGWLVEKAGFKGYHDELTGMATWEANALVLVNEHARSTADLLKFKQKIVDKVEGLFNISLEQEPELLPR
jgi:UDP-N-acetylmuramate dehydrogenase